MSCLQPRGLVPPDGWGAPYNGLYGEAPAERGNFFRLKVCKRVGISQAWGIWKCREIGHFIGISKGLWSRRTRQYGFIILSINHYMKHFKVLAWVSVTPSSVEKHFKVFQPRVHVSSSSSSKNTLQLQYVLRSNDIASKWTDSDPEQIQWKRFPRTRRWILREKQLRRYRKKFWSILIIRGQWSSIAIKQLNILPHRQCYL